MLEKFAKTFRKKKTKFTSKIFIPARKFRENFDALNPPKLKNLWNSSFLNFRLKLMLRYLLVVIQETTRDLSDRDTAKKFRLSQFWSSFAR